MIRIRSEKQLKALFRFEGREMVTTAEACDMLAITRQGWHLAARKQGFRPVQRNGREMLWRKQDVADYADMREPWERVVWQQAREG